MRIFDQESPNLGESIIESIELETQKEIFALSILDKNKEETELETIIVFTDRMILLAKITIEEIGGKLATRIKGNFV
jgi:hypothetical protein